MPDFLNLRPVRFFHPTGPDELLPAAGVHGATVEHLDIGTRRAGRTLEDIDRPHLIACSIDLNREKAIDVSQEPLVQYISQQPHIVRSSGLSQDLVDKLKAILSWPTTHEEIERAKQFVPLELVHRVTASGTPEVVRTKAEESRQQGRPA